MSLVIATGSNLGDRRAHLKGALDLLGKKFSLIAESRIYESAAVDYLDQPAFYNQVLEFRTPEASPEAVMDELLQIEKMMGRERHIPKGPRVIDLDILFWDDLHLASTSLTLPHPRLFTRSFVVLPLSELPIFETLKKKHTFSFDFDEPALPIS